MHLLKVCALLHKRRDGGICKKKSKKNIETPIRTNRNVQQGNRTVTENLDFSLQASTHATESELMQKHLSPRPCSKRRGQNPTSAMTPDSLDLHEAHHDPAEVWARCIPQLKSEIARLTNLLSTLTTEETEAQEQLESLTYALGLTKGELARRKRSNNELSQAYQTGRRSSTTKPDDLVQKLEGELLNAKRDSANMEYEVEHLEFRLKKLREGDVFREPISPVVVQSPGLRSPRMSIRSPMASPQMKQGRLIGDVDAVICLDKIYVPCRIGVSAGGGLGVYTYDSAECLLCLDEIVSEGDLLAADRDALKEWLRCVEVDIGEGNAVIVGLAEGVRACIQIVREVGTGIKDG